MASIGCNLRTMKLSENQATLAFLLPSAFKELFAPRMLVIEHSFADGYFCHQANGDPISETEIQQLEEFLRNWLWDDEPFKCSEWPRDRLIEELYKINSTSLLTNCVILWHYSSFDVPFLIHVILVRFI